jgi:hypothetical protein
MTEKAPAPPERPIYEKGKRINEWEIVRHIGHGGYGEIYEVSLDGQHCAMKVEMKDSK